MAEAYIVESLRTAGGRRKGVLAGVFEQDEGVRFDASLERLATVRTIQDGGSITAGNASQISDRLAGMVARDLQPA